METSTRLGRSRHCGRDWDLWRPPARRPRHTGHRGPCGWAHATLQPGPALGTHLAIREIGLQSSRLARLRLKFQSPQLANAGE